MQELILDPHLIYLWNHSLSCPRGAEWPSYYRGAPKFLFDGVERIADRICRLASILVEGDTSRDYDRHQGELAFMDFQASLLWSSDASLQSETAPSGSHENAGRLQASTPEGIGDVEIEIETQMNEMYADTVIDSVGLDGERVPPDNTERAPQFVAETVPDTFPDDSVAGETLQEGSITPPENSHAHAMVHETLGANIHLLDDSSSSVAPTVMDDSSTITIESSDTELADDAIRYLFPLDDIPESCWAIVHDCPMSPLLFIVGITASPEDRWISYYMEGYLRMFVLFRSNDPLPVEQLEIRLISELGEKVRACTRADKPRLANIIRGGEGQMRRKPPPYFTYMVVADAQTMGLTRLQRQRARV